MEENQLDFLNGLFEKEDEEFNLNKDLKKVTILISVICSLGNSLCNKKSCKKDIAEIFSERMSRYDDSYKYFALMIHLKNYETPIMRIAESKDVASILEAISRTRLDLKILLNKIIRNYNMDDYQNEVFNKGRTLLSL